MPAMRHYIVTETRQVRVSATTPIDAIETAQAAFDGKDVPEYTTGTIKGDYQVTKLEAIRD